MSLIVSISILLFSFFSLFILLSLTLSLSHTLQEFEGPGMVSCVDQVLGMTINGEEGEDISFVDTGIPNPYLQVICTCDLFILRLIRELINEPYINLWPHFDNFIYYFLFIISYLIFVIYFLFFYFYFYLYFFFFYVNVRINDSTVRMRAAPPLQPHPKMTGQDRIKVLKIK